MRRPGAPARVPADRYRSPRAHRLPPLRRLHRWTASVCAGALFLGAAGLLTGKAATTHWSAVRELESYGATYIPERVVTHPGDRLIIGAGVSAGIDLAITLAAHLASPAHAQAYQLGLEYDPRPPYDAGSLAKAPAEAKALLGVADG